MRHIFIIAALLVATTSAFQAAAATPDIDDYMTRHVTFWYGGEDEFIRFEDGMRTSPGPLVGRYGPENMFLMLRIEEVYAITSRTVGIDPRGFRVNVELVQSANSEEEPDPDADTEMLDGFGVYYDPRSNTVYIDSSDLGPEALAAGLAVALLSHDKTHTPPRPLIEAAVRSVKDAVGRSFGPEVPH